jgi:hypothetical protein
MHSSFCQDPVGHVKHCSVQKIKRQTAQNAQLALKQLREDMKQTLFPSTEKIKLTLIFRICISSFIFLITSSCTANQNKLTTLSQCFIVNFTHVFFTH